MQFFTERAAHGYEIVTSHDNRGLSSIGGVHRVGMIANVNNGSALTESRPQLTREQNEFVDVSEPFAEKISNSEKFSKNWSRRCDFDGNPGRDQSLQHHRGETLHALLAIKRIITDQQNHWCARYEATYREFGLRKPNVAVAAWARLTRRFPRRHRTLALGRD